MPRFETLDPRVITKLAQVLANRVAERFPSRGLTQAAIDLAKNAVHITSEAASLSRTDWVLKLSGGTLAIFGAGTAFAILAQIPWKAFTFEKPDEFVQAVQGLDAVFHLIGLASLALLFFLTLENRIKRKRALEGLQGLRAYAHVIDVHQLNKDPAAIAANLPRTRSSPERDLTARELLRYLDYCSEMLSVISKFAALYAQNSNDAVVLAAVNDVEQLTTSLSNKIWQKLMIIHAAIRDDAHRQEDATRASVAAE